MNIFYEIVKGLYLFSGTRNIAGLLIKVFDGDEFNSKILRKIYDEKYNMNVGIGSYGCFIPEFNFYSDIIIGNYCSFASGVQFIPGNHPIKDVSTHPFFHRPEFGFVKKAKDNNSKPTIVGNDVWIGKNAIILPKCKRIGNGAIIGAGAVVTKDVEPYSIIAGVPAKKIGQRCSDELIADLLDIKWWDWPTEVIKKNIHLFNNELDKETVEKFQKLAEGI